MMELKVACMTFDLSAEHQLYCRINLRYQIGRSSGTMGTICMKNNSSADLFTPAAHARH